MSKVHIFFSAFLLLPFCLLSDWLIHQHYFFKQEYWGVYDNWVHGVIAVLVVLPLLSEKFGEPLRFAKLAQNATVIFLIASLLDLDHFAVNFSFSLTKAISLTMRPATHSITFAIVASATYFLFTKNKKWTWFIFAAIASHVVRDDYGGGTPIFYPLHISQISYWCYLVSEYLILATSILFSRKLVNS